MLLHHDDVDALLPCKVGLGARDAFLIHADQHAQLLAQLEYFCINFLKRLYLLLVLILLLLLTLYRLLLNLSREG